MKKTVSLIIISLLLLLIAGCAFGGNPAEKDPDTTVTLQKDGHVLQIIRESFGESNYDIGELRNEIELELEDYNAQPNKSAELKKAESENGVTDVEILFGTPDDYSLFNQETLRVGEIGDFLLMPGSFPGGDGISISGLVNARTGEVITEDEINALSSEKILVSDVSDRIYLPGKVLYISDNAYSSEGVAAVRRKEDAAGFIYIIFR
ncbi:MAG: hypothetical protein K6F53_10690 [Lachnospiraceae bacterium]|nr:hypothetical protein [Lachnospiraceae bacterium]